MFNSIVDKVIRIVNLCLPDKLDSSNIQCDLIDYGFDSIALIKIIISLEEEFNIDIPNCFHLIDEMNTIDKIVNILKSILDEGEPL